MNSTAEHIITCEKVSFGYDGYTIIRSLDLRVRRGDYLCIVGENGCGKSTLIKGLLGLIAPIGGKLTMAAGLTAGGIGYLAQDAAAKKDFPAGVKEIALSGNVRRAGMRPWYTAAEKRRAEKCLTLMGISALQDRCFRELSGGQQRRALLARALCAAEHLLVLDEPAAGLDPLISAEVYRLLADINQKEGITIIMVSHDLAAAKRYAGGIITLGKPLLETQERTHD